MAREVWSKLEGAFDDSGLTRRVGFLNGLIKTGLTLCESMRDYVNRIVSTAHQLSRNEFAIPEQWIGSFLLAGLPDEFRSMIITLIFRAYQSLETS